VIVVDGCPPHAAHNALLGLKEYRDALAEAARAPGAGNSQHRRRQVLMGFMRRNGPLPVVEEKRTGALAPMARPALPRSTPDCGIRAWNAADDIERQQEV
jgi:hypothetical protein